MGILNQMCSRLFMGRSIAIVEKLKAQAKVIDVSVSPQGKSLAFAERGRVVIKDGNVHVHDGITAISHINEESIVIAHRSGLTCYNGEEIIWKHEDESGAELLVTNNDYIAYTDGLGRTHVLSVNGDHIFDADVQSTLHVSIGPDLAISDEAGVVRRFSWEGEMI